MAVGWGGWEARLALNEAGGCQMPGLVTKCAARAGLGPESAATGTVGAALELNSAACGDGSAIRYRPIRPRNTIEDCRYHKYTQVSSLQLQISLLALYLSLVSLDLSSSLHGSTLPSSRCHPHS